ncbi:MAG: hypothetical protein KVP17_002210 [Porospora cf. gigantea B]|uniref:uncharacterized protein n=1 Tax=Porospora cf. gigantea B TaxID=2853592 RepID=UPI003571A204|nr:MAG: hypothetical protein KVP17_002210 [Porospora cf. gigantea B]
MLGNPLVAQRVATFLETPRDVFTFYSLDSSRFSFRHVACTQQLWQQLFYRLRLHPVWPEKSWYANLQEGQRTQGLWRQGDVGSECAEAAFPSIPAACVSVDGWGRPRVLTCTRGKKVGLSVLTACLRQEKSSELNLNSALFEDSDLEADSYQGSPTWASGRKKFRRRKSPGNGGDLGAFHQPSGKFLLPVRRNIAAVIQLPRVEALPATMPVCPQRIRDSVSCDRWEFSDDSEWVVWRRIGQRSFGYADLTQSEDVTISLSWAEGHSDAISTVDLVGCGGERALSFPLRVASGTQEGELGVWTPREETLWMVAKSVGPSPVSALSWLARRPHAPHEVPAVPPQMEGGGDDSSNSENSNEPDTDSDSVTDSSELTAEKLPSDYLLPDDYLRCPHLYTETHSNPWLLAAGEWGGGVVMYDTRQALDPVLTFVQHKTAVTVVQPAVGGKSLVTGDVDGKVCLWDLRRMYEPRQKLYCPGLVDRWLTRSYSTSEGLSVLTFGAGLLSITNIETCRS